MKRPVSSSWRWALCALASLAVAVPAAAQGGKFPIVATTEADMSRSLDFDGVNFLVSIQGSNASQSDVGYQRVSPAGTLVGQATYVGRSGGAPLVAYSGSVHLMVWEDDLTDPNDHVYGQIISAAGGLVGAPFPITTQPLPEVPVGVASDGTGFLVAYTREGDPTPGLHRVFGRIVTPAGGVGPELVLSSGYGVVEGSGNAAFDGVNYLVVWNDDQNGFEVWGRFVSPTGGLEAEFPINVSPAQNHEFSTAVLFDGASHLVAWADDVGGAGEWDILGQLVSPAGALVGGVIPICAPPGAQVFPCLGTDGVHWLVTWTDMANDANGNQTCDPGEQSCWDLWGRYLTPLGTPMGAEWPIVTWNDDQFGTALALGAGKFLMVFNDGTMVPETGDVWGTFLPPAGFPVPYCTAKVNSKGCTPEVTFSGIPSASDPDPFAVGAVQVINNKNGILFYGYAPNNLPFQGGYLCVQPPIKRTPVQNSGGNPPPNDCSGSFSFNFNGQIQGGADPGLVPGVSVYDQYWYRDPQSSSTTGLSDAVAFDVLP